MNILALQGVIQHYAWGGQRFIPELIAVDNNQQQPYAELWIGTHHKGPAMVQNQVPPMDLITFTAKQGANFLGEKVMKEFGQRLPYLFKVLDVNKMLSIQTHPTKKAAETGFALENEKGIPLTARHRNYRDDNHKPEVMVALTDFWLLHGFQSLEGIRQVLNDVPEFSSLLPIFEAQGIFGLYKTIMEMPQQEVNALLHPLQERLQIRFAKGELNRHQADYWAALAFQDYTTASGDYDRGVFSIYLYNLVYLQEGEGIFQAAGIPHAYLEGVNMELMANSDNVFRGGLTPKHIDVPELLQHLTVEPITPAILKGTPRSETEAVYPTPAPDFELSRITLAAKQTHQNSPSTAPDALIVMQGQVSIKSNDQVLVREQGEICMVIANSKYEIYSKQGAVLFKATVP